MLHYSKDMRRAICGTTGEFSITNKKDYADCPRCKRILNGIEVKDHGKYDPSIESKVVRGNYGY